MNVVLSKLIRRLKLSPDLNINQVYSTAEMKSTLGLGACSAFPMRFEKSLLTAPAVVLENESYYMLVRTRFLR